MSILISVLISVGIAHLLVNVTGLSSRSKKLFGFDAWEYKKPFDCLVCMSWWISIIYSGITFENLETFLASIFGALLISSLLDSKL